MTRYDLNRVAEHPPSRRKRYQKTRAIQASLCMRIEPHKKRVIRNDSDKILRRCGKIVIFQTSELREDITCMTLYRTIPTVGLLQKKVHGVLAIGLLAVASAVGCGASRPAQRSTDSGTNSPSAAKSAAEPPKQLNQEAEQAPAQQGDRAGAVEKTAVQGGPPLQAQPSAVPAASSAQSDEGKDSGDRIPEGAITGKIVSSFRGDDGTTTLYLNQGSEAKLRVNMTGNILEGSEGGKKLDGGSFTITKVLGDNQSVAASKYGKSLGKNNRFMIIKPK